MKASDSTSTIITFNGIVDGQTSMPTVRRWNGKTQTCTEWNCLRKDPDLWLQNGTCHVHLYEKGQSKRGPSFKLPISRLLSAKCHPLIDRFLEVDGSRPRTAKDLERWSRLASKKSIELYIPAPPFSDKREAYEYHLATRNFFAWVCGQPLVGDHLGRAFVSLLHSMQEFRATGVDNLGDLMAYAGHQGYRNLVCQPDYAMAVLHFAGASKLKDAYIQAFCHCVGMSDMLYDSSEYQYMDRATKKLIRKHRSDMDSRLYQAFDMLRNFLDDELSESYLGLPAGARSHLERFRSFLLSFYTTQLGYYPPRSFDPDLLRAMREDFEALYDLLVDEDCSQEGTINGAAGGICTLQLVQSFDARCRYPTLMHPLPRLPEISLKRTRKPSWLAREASNWNENVFQNDLVRAYRKFEENSIVSPNKSDKRDKVTIVDARKVRWILVYAVFQVLRSVTDEPPEVRDELEVPYHLAVHTGGLPPWENKLNPKPLRRRHTEIGADKLSTPASRGETSPAAVLEIKPDVDYFALTHGSDIPRGRQMSATVTHGRQLSLPSRASSLTRALSRNQTIRSSIRMFKSVTTRSPNASSSPKSPPYHEIVVHGYGNGTNGVRLGKKDAKVVGLGLTVRCDSNASTLSSKTTPSLDSAASTLASTETVVASANSRSNSLEEASQGDESPLERWQGSVPMEVDHQQPKTKIPKRYTMGAIFDKWDALTYQDLVEHERAKAFPEHSPNPVSRRNSLLVDLKRISRLGSSRSVPERLNQLGSDHQPSHWDQDEWSAMEAFMGNSGPQSPDNDDPAAWEQYADLGGFKQLE
ncbi:hypothetical protein HJFPF1_02636 [Paramyrothecium foliicola]|nr:hypothetical protein HJFPF1_02636 [Paramyrothecium foliicola]